MHGHVGRSAVLSIVALAFAAAACGDHPSPSAERSPIATLEGDGATHTPEAEVTTQARGSSRPGGGIRAFMRNDPENPDLSARDLGPGDEALLAYILQENDVPGTFWGGFNTTVRELRGGGELPDGRVDVAFGGAFLGGESDDDDTATLGLGSALLRFDESVDAEALFIAELPDDDLEALRADVEASLEEGEQLEDVEWLSSDEFGAASVAMRSTVRTYEFDYDTGEYRTGGEVLAYITSEVVAFARGRYMAVVYRTVVGDEPTDVEVVALARLVYDRLDSAP